MMKANFVRILRSCIPTFGKEEPKTRQKPQTNHKSQNTSTASSFVLSMNIYMRPHQIKPRRKATFAHLWEITTLRATPLLLLPAMRQESSLVCSMWWIFRWSDIYYAAWDGAGTTKQDSSHPACMPLIYKNLQSNCYPTTPKFLLWRKKWGRKKKT